MAAIASIICWQFMETPASASTRAAASRALTFFSFGAVYFRSRVGSAGGVCAVALPSGTGGATSVGAVVGTEESFALASD